MKISIIALSILFLASCSSVQTRMNITLDGYKGQKIENFITNNGAPARTMDISATKRAWIYERRQLDGYDTYGGGLNANYSFCDVTLFTNPDGIIESYTWRGNAC